jgi:hypothetical protein
MLAQKPNPMEVTTREKPHGPLWPSLLLPRKSGQAKSKTFMVPVQEVGEVPWLGSRTPLVDTAVPMARGF